jgi:peptide deformylase
VPQTLLINPVIHLLSNEQEAGWEGCLSVPGMRGLVSRYNHIRYSGFDAAGNPIEVEARGFHARVVQHECDHLDGILYPQKLDDPRQFGFIEELTAAGYLD